MKSHSEKGKTNKETKLTAARALESNYAQPRLLWQDDDITTTEKKCWGSSSSAAADEKYEGEDGDVESGFLSYWMAAISTVCVG